MPSHRLLLIIAYLGFISLGLPDTLIGVAWPSVRRTFDLQQSAVALIFIGSGCTYFLSSFFTGRILKAMGIGVLLAGSSALVAASGFGFGLAPWWSLFAACALLHGLGSGAIDAGLNHYVAHHFSARHMNWLHACYSIGATLGPLIMTTVIARHTSWRTGYLIVASTLLVLALLFTFTRRRWNGPADEKSVAAESAAAPASMREAFRHPLLWRQILLFFFYTGLESSAGQWSYTVLTEMRGFSAELAGGCVTAYWGSIAAGRVLFGFIVDRVGIDRLLRASMIATIGGTLLFALSGSAFASGFALVLIGLGLAPIFPCMMTRTPERLGPEVAAHAIGFQVSAAMIGVAVLPSLCGILGQRLGLGTVTTATVIMAAVVFLLHESLLRSPSVIPPLPDTRNAGNQDGPHPS